MSFPIDLVKNRLFKLMNAGTYEIKLETTNLLHYIRRMVRKTDERDDGKFRWNFSIRFHENMANGEGSWDVSKFPRYYLLEESCINEVLEWCKANNEDIIKIESREYN